MEKVSVERKGYFGEFGGSFVPPELQLVLNEMETQFFKYKDDRGFYRRIQLLS